MHRKSSKAVLHDSEDAYIVQLLHRNKWQLRRLRVRKTEVKAGKRGEC